MEISDYMMVWNECTYIIWDFLLLKYTKNDELCRKTEYVFRDNE